MSFQERRDLASLIGTIAFTAIYVWVLAGRVETHAIDLATDLRFWGAAFLIFVPVQVVAKIVFMILFMIVNTIATQREEPDITDEMDRIIELRSVRISGWVFMGGFFVAMGALTAGMGLQAMFGVFAVTVVLCGVTMDVAHIVYYRRGV